MAEGKRDANNRVVLMGVSSVDGVTPLPLTVDPVTGRLRCVVTGSSVMENANPDAPLARDANRKVVLGAETDDANRTVTAISVNTNGLMMEI